MSDSLRQTQEIRMQQRLTPMQVQFVRMLEMTTPEIEEEVRHALAENPALESVDGPHAGDSGDMSDSGDDGGQASGDTDMDTDYPDDDDMIPSGMSMAGCGGTSAGIYPVAEEESLIGYLQSQLGELEISGIVRDVAMYIIGNIDSNGRLTRTPYEIVNDLAFSSGIVVSLDVLQKAYDIVRSLDPAGIGAVDLRDCLLLQLKRMPPSREVDTATEIIAHYYDMYSNKRFDRLRAHLGVSPEVLRAADDLIHTLNPKPGAQFGASRLDDAASAIYPDFAVDVEDGNVTVSLTAQYPELAIASTFSLDGTASPGRRRNTREEVARTFVKHHHDEAELFMRLLKMRGDTLLRTMEAIVRIQRSFFLTDEPGKIRPMVLRDIADITGQDLSVISRATSGKYVSTRSGIYPLKMFFSERPSGDTDGSIHRVLAELKDVIEGEDKSRPLSDEALREEMERRGYVLARRTVAKYREEKLGLPVARLRKKV